MTAQQEPQLIAGLDVGSSAIRIAIGQVGQAQSEALHIIGIAEVPATGISKGVISSIEDAVSSISSCLEKAERMVGVGVTSVWLGISGSHIMSQESKGVIAVARSDGEITEDDIERSIEAARTVATPPNYEILHVIPKSFSVDGQLGIKDPIGMTGVRVEVDTQIIQGLSSQIKNLTKAVYRARVDINDLVLSILATAESVLSPRQKDLGVVVLNMGAATTTMVVFEEGEILHTAVIPIGSDHITSDIAIGLRTSIDAAERIKLEEGAALAADINKRDEIDIGGLEGGESNYISKKYIAEIIEARVEEIFEKVDYELKKVDRSGKLPAGVVLTGGGAQLPELVPSAKKYLRLPARLGNAQNISTAIDKALDPAFTTAIGLVQWGMHMQSHQKPSRFNFNGKMPDFGKLGGSIKKIFNRFIP